MRYEMTDEEVLEEKLNKLQQKRDYAADVLEKPMLALTYQMEMDELLKLVKP